MQPFALRILLFLLLTTSTTFGQTDVIIIEGPWKFSPSDSPAFALPEFDESAWAPVSSGQSWERQGFDKLDGHVWYRVRLFIPSTIRDHARVSEGLRLFLGKVDDIDQTYLNGWMIGSNGENVAPGVAPDTGSMARLGSSWDEERIYTIPLSDPRIQWDGENVLAVRVYDGGGPGGLWSGTPHLRALAITDLLGIDHAANVFHFELQWISKTFSVSNLSKHLPIRGTLIVRALDGISGSEGYRKDFAFALKPGAIEQYSISIPAPQRSLVVEYQATFAEFTETISIREEAPYMLTPPVTPAPRINGPTVVGARPGRPFHFLIPVSGTRPLEFEVAGLPPGLTVDPLTGIIAGRTGERGTFRVDIAVKNAFGDAKGTLMLDIGEKLALTPPMGWNSWNAWGLAVDQDKVLASARAYREKGLAEHGWSYINVDDGWEIVGDSPLPKRDDSGKILVNDKFPDMKALGDSLHALGLKFGIYSSPGPLTCGGYTASYGYEKNDAESYATWGVDYLKYDWCSYGNIAKDLSRPELMKPYSLMRRMLDEVNRDIVFSLCQYGMGNVWEWGADVGGDLWRTTGDITDTWVSVSSIGFRQGVNAPFAAPGQWNDPDMLVVGWVGWGPHLHPSRLTPDEQYTHISLWCLLSAPLLIGCDLTRLDPFTLNLLTNDEVLAVDQDPLGKQATPSLVRDSIQVWTKPLADGTTAVGIFNIGSLPRSLTIVFSEIGLPEQVTFRDLWRQRTLLPAQKSASFDIPRHGVIFLKTES